MCREGGGEGLIYNVCAVIFIFNTLTNEEGGLKDLQLLTLSDSPQYRTYTVPAEPSSATSIFNL